MSCRGSVLESKGAGTGEGGRCFTVLSLRTCTTHLILVMGFDKVSLGKAV